jgi:hypothetical protein
MRHIATRMGQEVKSQKCLFVVLLNMPFKHHVHIIHATYLVKI